jgi:hypothetical protein
MLTGGRQIQTPPPPPLGALGFASAAGTTAAATPMTVIMSAIILVIGATSSRVVSGTEICTGAPAGEGGRLAFGVRVSVLH